MTITLTVTAKGQITLRKEVLKHLGKYSPETGASSNVDLLKAFPQDTLSTLPISRPKRGKSVKAASDGCGQSE